MKRHSVLIAEGDPRLRGLYARGFKSAAYSVRTAGTGEEALSLVAAAAPDLLVLDLGLPGFGGTAVLEGLPPASRSFPVLVLGFGDPFTTRRVRALGADDLLDKMGLSFYDLLSRADQLVQGISAG